MRALLYCLCTGIALGAASVHAGDVYRYIDDDGQVHYSDKPPADAAERLAIRSEPTDEVRIDIHKKRLAENKAARAEERARKEAEKALDAERKAEKVNKCEAARKRVVRYEQSHRMYESLPDGERRYYTAEEQTAAINKARADVREHCTD